MDMSVPSFLQSLASSDDIPPSIILHRVGKPDGPPPSYVVTHTIFSQKSKTLKETGNRQVHVEYLVPARMVSCKKKLMQFGRRQKSAGVISSYDVMVKNNEPVLRTFKHGTGVVYVKVNDIEQQNQQDNSQMEI